MWVRVLGSAAGGGFPQWNCNCPNCRGVRDRSLPCSPRTQSSIAVSADYRYWFLFTASPDIRSQINASPLLYPQEGLHHTPIQGIVLSDAEMDHTLGLLSLRETSLQRIYATEWVYNALTRWNPFLHILNTYCSVEWYPVRLQALTALRNMYGEDSGLLCQAFTTLSSKTIAFAAGPTVHPESVVGYRITDRSTSRTLVYIPAVQELNESVLGHLHDCACLLIDGTCWSDDELVCLGIGQKTAHSMGHLPIGGENESLEQLAVLSIERIYYIHINNTNPIVIENSLQRHAVEERGLAVASDSMGLEI